MGWGHWLAPEISQEVEFRLKVQELEVRKLFKRNPEAVLHHALLLARETARRVRPNPPGVGGGGADGIQPLPVSGEN